MRKFRRHSQTVYDMASGRGQRRFYPRKKPDKEYDLLFAIPGKGPVRWYFGHSSGMLQILDSMAGSLAMHHDIKWRIVAAKTGGIVKSNGWGRRIKRSSR